MDGIIRYGGHAMSLVAEAVSGSVGGVCAGEEFGVGGGSGVGPRRVTRGPDGR